MKIFSQILSYLLPFLYLTVVYVYYCIFFGKRKDLENKTAFILVALLMIHSLQIITRIYVLGAIPLSTLFDVLSFLSFSILFIYMLIELSIRNKASGLFVMSFAFLLKLISSYNYSWEPVTNEMLKNPAFAVHASMNVMGYTAISLSALYSLMYIIQHYNMKRHRFGIFYDKMPPLNFLETKSMRAVEIGVILLGVGIFLGHVQSRKIFGSFWLADPKVIISDIVWAFYFISYVLTVLLKWKGRLMACLSLFAFLILMASWVLVFVLTETFHKF